MLQCNLQLYFCSVFSPSTSLAAEICAVKISPRSTLDCVQWTTYIDQLSTRGNILFQTGKMLSKRTLQKTVASRMVAHIDPLTAVLAHCPPQWCTDWQHIGPAWGLRIRTMSRVLSIGTGKPVGMPATTRTRTRGGCAPVPAGTENGLAMCCASGFRFEAVDNMMEADIGTAGIAPM
ncbi:hypothetical protein GGX14DRAFT_403354 [Mycena pura]|uniref:Uncharacterized protein n=1 Tax=Mycena pura TaxID=153505 RepID=A0AAD6UWU5_9AGAR|nr:hypothetical protein GGX14DRAFT_403354 [Mycena pura]